MEGDCGDGRKGEGVCGGWDAKVVGSGAAHGMPLDQEGDKL